VLLRGVKLVCAPKYCGRSRPAARQGESEESSTCHVGFRCIIRIPQE
ncbi:MAG: formylglycine-generating enzyme family protein, partial [Rhodococcus sp. (in: high G+C Gram-positive bacteria)]|nr:formylglycine-generating enzyme family protein [Rhodococcus sp. (in: high G+C Gram-positive bacteria)]